MPRSNRTKRAPQRIKHRVEDRMARRAMQRTVDQGYRDEARQTTIHPDGHVVLTFTDPSWAV